MFNNNDGRNQPSGFSFPWRGGLVSTFAAFVLMFVTLTLTGSLTHLAEEAISGLPLLRGIDPMVFGAAFELFSYCTIFGVTVLVLYGITRSGQGLGKLTHSTFGLLKARFGHALGIGALGYIASVALIMLTYTVLPLPEPYSPAGEFAKTLSGPAFWFFALSAVVAAPILEELLFRGLMQNMLRGSLRNGLLSRVPGLADVVAVVVTGAIFAIMHGTLTGFPPLFITGTLLGAVYLRTNNLWTAIAMHAFNNAVATALLWAAIS